VSQQRLFVRIRGKVLGPFDLKQLRLQRDRGILGKVHEVSEDRISWTPASSLAELFPPEEQLYEGPSAETPHHRGVSLPPLPTSRRAPELPTAQPGEPTWYYVDQNGTQKGPVTVDRLHRLLDEGIVRRETNVWNHDQEEWRPLEQALNLSFVVGGAGIPGARGGFALSIASLVLSCLWVGGLGSVAGVACGLLTLLNKRQQGRGMAIAGVLIGIAGFFFTLVGIGLLFWLWQSPAAHSTEQVAGLYRDRVYQVHTKSGSGSSILLANNRTRGLIATNLHVISPQLEKARGLRRLASANDIPKDLTVGVKHPGQLESKKAHLAAIHRDFDLALLVLELDNVPPWRIEVIRKRHLKDGEPAVALGYPLGLAFFTTDGCISSTSGEEGYIWTTCSISSGNSGGPLFLKRGGKLVGLNTMGLTPPATVGFDEKGRVVAQPRAVVQNMNGAVPAEEIVLSLQEGRTDNWVWTPTLKPVVLELGKMVVLKD
jgi:hypothetical protein